MITPYLLYIKIGLAALVLIGLFGAGYQHGAKHVQAEWDQAKAAQEVAEHEALLARLKFNESVANRHKEENQQLAKGYQDEIANLRATAANSKRLRIPASACRSVTVSTAPDSTAGSNEGSATDGLLSEETSRAFQEYALKADETAAQLRAAQEFIKVNGMSP